MCVCVLSRMRGPATIVSMFRPNTMHPFFLAHVQICHRYFEQGTGLPGVFFLGFLKSAILVKAVRTDPGSSTRRLTNYGFGKETVCHPGVRSHPSRCMCRELTVFELYVTLDGNLTLIFKELTLLSLEVTKQG